VPHSPEPALEGAWTGILTLSGFRQSMGSLRDANIVFPSVAMEAARGDGAIDLDNAAVSRIRQEDYLVGSVAEFFLVKDSDPIPSGANRFHVGVIGRGDVEIDRFRVRITCRDRMEAEDCRIPRKTYGPESPVEERQFGQPVPILIGEWNRESSDYWIGATCVDTALTTTNRSLRARLCDPGENGIGSFGIKARWLDSDGRFKRDETGYREQSIVIVDATEGIFELAGTDYETIERRWEEGDRIQVCRPTGNLDASGNLLASPADVIRHFLTDRRVGMGLPEDALDLSSFDAVGSVARDYGYRCRGYIAQETTVLKIIAEICAEFGMKLIVRNGLYALALVGLPASSSEPSRIIDAGRILDWSEWNDRRKAGGENLILKYRLRPGDDVFTRTTAFSVGAEAEKSLHRMECRWIFDDETTQARGAIWALSCGGVLKTVLLETDFEGIGVALGDYVRVEWPEGGDIFQVTEIDFDFNPPIRLSMELQALNRTSGAGIWTAEPGEQTPSEFGGGLMPAGWNDASLQQKQKLSFWADEPGMNPDGAPGKAWSR
jgi:hypothetical protein